MRLLNIQQVSGDGTSDTVSSTLLKLLAFYSAALTYCAVAMDEFIEEMGSSAHGWGLGYGQGNG